MPHKLAPGTWAYEKACRRNDPADAPILAAALRYIELRGEALPYRVIRVRGLVRFETK